MRKLVVIGYTVLLVATPGVAFASDVGGSKVYYTTDGKVRTSSNYWGPATGHTRVCADQTGAVIGQGGSLAWVKRDLSYQPDPTISYVLVEGGRPLMCGGLGATSTRQRYYTRVQASFDRASGWAVARNS